MGATSGLESAPAGVLASSSLRLEPYKQPFKILAHE